MAPTPEENIKNMVHYMVISVAVLIKKELLDIAEVNKVIITEESYQHVINHLIKASNKKDIKLTPQEKKYASFIQDTINKSIDSAKTYQNSHGNPIPPHSHLYYGLGTTPTYYLKDDHNFSTLSTLSPPFLEEAALLLLAS